MHRLEIISRVKAAVTDFNALSPPETRLSFNQRHSILTLFDDAIELECGIGVNNDIADGSHQLLGVHLDSGGIEFPTADPRLMFNIMRSACGAGVCVSIEPDRFSPVLRMVVDELATWLPANSFTADNLIDAIRRIHAFRDELYLRMETGSQWPAALADWIDTAEESVNAG